MKRGSVMLIIASLLIGAGEPLWAQQAQEAATWITPAYGEGGVVASTAYGEIGLWVTSAYSGTDVGTLRAGSGGGAPGSTAAPASRIRSNLGDNPSFETRKSQPIESPGKAAKTAALSSTNAPSTSQLSGSTTNAMPSIAPSTNSQSNGAVPTPDAKFR